MTTSGVALFFVFQVPGVLEKEPDFLAYDLSGLISMVGAGIFIGLAAMALFWKPFFLWFPPFWLKKILLGSVFIYFLRSLLVLTNFISSEA